MVLVCCVLKVFFFIIDDTIQLYIDYFDLANYINRTPPPPPPFYILNIYTVNTKIDRLNIYLLSLDIWQIEIAAI